MTSPIDVSSLAGAIVEANDRLLGLIELTGMSVDSLEANTQIRRILEVALDLLPAEGAAVTGHPELSVGHSNAAGTDHTARAMSSVDTSESIEVVVTRRTEAFGTPEHKIAQAVANLVARAVRIARLHTEAVQRAVLVQDHRSAAALAQGMIPPPGSEPVVDGVALHARTEPARHAGGDLYVWAADGDSLGFAIGDVSGKGLPAAVMMATVVSATQNAFRRHGSEGAASCMRAINSWVGPQLSDAGMFVTLCVGYWLPATGTVEVVNAGHSPVVLATPRGTERIPATAPPIGVLDVIDPSVWSRRPQTGEILVLATDGMTEQNNASGVALGEDPFDQLVAARGRTTTDATSLSDALFDEVASHADTAEQSDDRTAMILRFTGPISS